MATWKRKRNERKKSLTPIADGKVISCDHWSNTSPSNSSLKINVPRHFCGTPLTVVIDGEHVGRDVVVRCEFVADCCTGGRIDINPASKSSTKTRMRQKIKWKRFIVRLNFHRVLYSVHWTCLDKQSVDCSDNIRIDRVARKSIRTKCHLVATELCPFDMPIRCHFCATMNHSIRQPRCREFLCSHCREMQRNLFLFRLCTEKLRKILKHFFLFLVSVGSISLTLTHTRTREPVSIDHVQRLPGIEIRNPCGRMSRAVGRGTRYANDMPMNV